MAENKDERIFQIYKNRLIKECLVTSGNSGLRFNCIEYLCSFPKINPYVMAASIANDGIIILYDDSSISKADNNKKERKVKRVMKEVINNGI